MSKRLNLLTGKWVEEKTTKRKNPEASVGHVVDKYVKLHGGYIRTIKSDGTKTPNGWRKSAQGAGISDRLIWMPNGISLAVELKAPGKKRTLSEAQYLFGKNLLDRGHRFVVADCIEDVKRALSVSLDALRDELNSIKPKTLEVLEPEYPTEELPW
jgi:hypothetical protein